MTTVNVTYSPTVLDSGALARVLVVNHGPGSIVMSNGDTLGDTDRGSYPTLGQPLRARLMRRGDDAVVDVTDAAEAPYVPGGGGGGGGSAPDLSAYETIAHAEATYVTEVQVQALIDAALAPTPPSTAFSDDFSRADGPVGNGWTPWTYSGTEQPVCAISDGHLLVAGFVPAAVHDAPVDDGYLQGRFVAGPSPALVWAASAPQTRYDWRSAGQIVRMVGGVETSLATDLSFAPGDLLKVQYAGNTHTLFKNGTQVGQITDPNPLPQAPRAGFGHINGGGTVSWDDAEIGSL